MKTPTFTDDLLKLIFNATPIANIADNAATGPLTALFVSLHTADPNLGNQTTSEVAYTGYARVSVARTTGGWVVASQKVSPVAVVAFGAMTAGADQEAVYFGIGTLVSGTGKLLYSAALSPSIPLTIGVIPRIDPLPPGAQLGGGWDD
jgi:hypothetical protein